MLSDSLACYVDTPQQNPTEQRGKEWQKYGAKYLLLLQKVLNHSKEFLCP